MRRVIVHKLHQPSARPPLVVEPGEQVLVGERDTTWPAFRLVSRPGGEDGWVPERCLRLLPGVSPEAALVLLRYDTTELAPPPGTVLDLVQLDAESGWAWCRDSRGAEGWLPRDTLDELS